jgi:hypothetical protein
MARPKNDFSKSNRISLRISDNDLKNLYTVRTAGDFKDDSESIRFCISFTNIVLNMLPAAIVESFIELSESHSTARNEPENERPQSSKDDKVG